MNNLKKYSLVDDLGFIKTGVNKFINTKKYYSTGSIKGKIFTHEGEYTYENRPSRANREVKEGDILQARMMNTNKIILVDKKLEGSLFSTGFFQFRPPKNLVVPKFLYYFLSSNYFLDKKNNLSGGATQKAISDSSLKQIKILLPGLSEQKIIVSKLDELFTKIDRKQILNENQKQSLASLIQSTTQSVFNKFSSQLEYIELQQLCSKITDGVHKKPNYVDDGVPFLKINNLTEGEGISFKGTSYITLDAHKEFIKRTHPERDDILITKDGTIGVVRKIDTDIEFSIFVSLALIKPKHKKQSDYLTHMLRSSFCQNQLNPSGTALKHIYLKDLKKLVVPISSDEINSKIVNTLNEFEEKIKTLSIIINNKNILYDKLKSAILVQELQTREVA